MSLERAAGASVVESPRGSGSTTRRVDPRADLLAATERNAREAQEEREAEELRAAAAKAAQEEEESAKARAEVGDAGVVHQDVQRVDLKVTSTDGETVTIDLSLDLNFDYFGLRTLYDRYLLRHPHTRKVIETPQQFFLRIACALSEDVPEALALYQRMGNLDYLPSSPTLLLLLLSSSLPPSLPSLSFCLLSCCSCWL